jgi:hypothetical protein
MAINVSTNKEALQVIFAKVRRAYYFPDYTKAFGSQTGGIELPVLKDGVTFNTGDPEKNEVKLTDDTTWLGNVSQGDSDISLQISSVAKTTNELFLQKNGSPVTGQFGEKSYTLQGFSLAPKKVTGALLLTSPDLDTIVYLPHVEMYASFNGEGGDDSTGYYNVAVTPLTDAAGNAIYLPNVDASADSSSSEG